MGKTEEMTVSLPSELAEAIRHGVSRGRYASESEVMRDAIRTWLRQEEEHEARLGSIRTRVRRSLDDPRPAVPIEDAFERIGRKLA